MEEPPPITLAWVYHSTRFFRCFCGTVDHFWDFFPVAGFESEAYARLSPVGRIADRAHHMFLPLLCYVISSFAVLTLLMKNALLYR